MRRSSRMRANVLGLALLLGLPASQAAAAWPDVSAGLPPQGGGERDAAVIVGIEDYAFVPDVAGAVDNAQGWYQFLTGARGVPVERARLLGLAQQ